jgi:hypothetical protein
MMLARIETEIQQNEKRTFECGVCDRSEAIVMRYK